MGRHVESVLVIGGGAGGAVAATALLRAASGPLRIRIVERDEVIGPGLAYRNDEQTLLLNNYVARMSAVEEDPAHLLRWCLRSGLAVGPHTFLPREVYGRYLTELVDDAVAAEPVSGARLRRTTGEVVALADRGPSYVATLADGRQLAADAVVLALGNPPPRPLPGQLEDSGAGDVGAGAGGGGEAQVPVVAAWSRTLPDRVERGQRVLLVGTGLTAVDVAAQLANAHHDVEMVMVSRHGRLPLVHEPAPPAPVLPFPVGTGPLPALLAEVRRRLHADGDWRQVVESLKISGNALWSGLSYADQERFVSHLARSWEIARHRMAPPMAAIIEGLLLDGRLRVTTTEALRTAGPDRGAGFDLVVNCTGPAPAWTPGWNPLVDQLTATGRLRPGPHGLGVDVYASGRLVDVTGRPARGLHVVGAARRGREWEVAAVPDLRRQAAGLVGSLAGAPAVPDFGREAG